MAKYNGSLLSIQSGGVAIELNNSVTLSVNTAEVECTNKDSSGWKEFLAGTKDWSMSGSSYIDHAASEGLDEAQADQLAGTLVTVIFSDAVTSNPKYTGTAYYTSIEQTGELDGAAEWTFTLSGTGALTAGTT